MSADFFFFLDVCEICLLAHSEGYIYLDTINALTLLSYAMKYVSVSISTLSFIWKREQDPPKKERKQVNEKSNDDVEGNHETVLKYSPHTPEYFEADKLHTKKEYIITYHFCLQTKNH